MAEIRLERVTKRFGEVDAVNNLNLEVRDKEFMVLVGPSGCGKSTVLRLIAGLETPTFGDIYTGGQPINHLIPKERDIALVFQSYALYPHLSVYDNIAFPLKIKKYPREKIRRKVDSVAEMLEIEDLLTRKPRELSGGQKQRVALGRAIVREPQAFLMDEPLSNLDAKLRIEMRAEIKKLQKRLGITTIYVTHDQIEAMTMGDRVAVMKDGVLQQVGNPRQIYRKPKNRFVAEFIGSPPMNFLDGIIKKRKGDLSLDLHDFKLTLVPGFFNKIEDQAGKEVIVGIRPSALLERPDGIDKSKGQSFKAMVDVVEPLGDEAIVHFIIGKNRLIALFSGESQLNVGDMTDVFVDLSKIYLFDKETEEAILK